MTMLPTFKKRTLLQREKNVQFGKVTVYQIKGREKLKAEKIWYQDKDYQTMQDDVDATLDIMIYNDMQSTIEADDNSSICSSSVCSNVSTADFDYDDNICSRGLEHLLPEHEVNLDNRRKQQWDAVLDEQDNQRKQNIENPEKIAEASRTRSVNTSQRIAHLRGLRDETTALEVHDDSMRDAMKHNNPNMPDQHSQHHRSGKHTTNSRNTKDNPRSRRPNSPSRRRRARSATPPPRRPRAATPPPRRPRRDISSLSPTPPSTVSPKYQQPMKPSSTSSLTVSTFGSTDSTLSLPTVRSGGLKKNSDDAFAPPPKYIVAYSVRYTRGREPRREIIGMTKPRKQIVRDAPTTCALSYSVDLNNKNRPKKEKR